MPVPTTKQIIFKGFSKGLNTRDLVVNLAPNELSDGRNVVIDEVGNLSKRYGQEILGSFSGTTTKILGQFFFENAAETQENLRVYDTSVERLVSNVWTSLTSVTMTTNKLADGAYFPITDKFYIVNKTDNVVKYASGTSGDQTDSSFKKGNYIVHFENRLLVANVSGQEDYVWYTDLGVDTFGTNNYFTTEGAVVGMEVITAKACLIFTRYKIYRLQNFTWTGVAAGPEELIDLGVNFGAVYDRSIVQGRGVVYFLGQDKNQKVQVYVTDGWRVKPIGEKIRGTLNNLSSALLSNAAGGFDGRYLHFSVTETGESVNSLELIYDTVQDIWLPPASGYGFSCYSSYNDSGTLKLIAGDASQGLTYLINENEGYDQLMDQSYFTGGDTDTNIAAATTTRASQGFKLSFPTSESATIVGAILKLKKISGTTTELTVNVETDNSDTPSGTLADVNATETIDAFTDTSYIYKTVWFSSPFSVTGSTTYHLVCKHTTEGSGNSIYAWHRDASSATYTDGDASTYASGSWTAQAGTDFQFAIITRSAINGYAIWGTDLGNIAHNKKLLKIFVQLAAEGDYNIQLGIKGLKLTGYTDTDVNTYASNYAWGAAGTIWGETGPWGGAGYVEQWFRPPVSANIARFFQFRIRNNKPEEHFKLTTTYIEYINLKTYR